MVLVAWAAPRFGCVLFGYPSSTQTFGSEPGKIGGR